MEMKEFDSDREEVIKRAREAGVEVMITIGSDLEGTLEGLKLAELHDFIYCAVGIHPHEAKDFSDQTYSLLKELAQKKKVIAIGETGLDYHYDHSPGICRELSSGSSLNWRMSQVCRLSFIAAKQMKTP